MKRDVTVPDAPDWTVTITCEDGVQSVETFVGKKPEPEPVEAGKKGKF